MLKISDFAQIAQVSTSALRYYDEIGIFKPLHVDSMTGYRYYDIGQLVQLNRILALKDLGLDLTQIVQLLDEELSSEVFHGMLRLRQVQLQKTISMAEEQLARIDARLDHLEKGGETGIPEVVLKPVKATTVAANPTGVTGFIPNQSFASEFADTLRRGGLKAAGYTHYIYHPSATADSGYDVEIAVPIETASIRRLRSSVSGELAIRELPEVLKMATTVHRGSPYTIGEAYQALGRWLQTQSYTIAGPCRKVCLKWSGNHSDYLTEIQFPVEA
jgi:DNA-binding transcriptional MerR regulator